MIKKIIHIIWHALAVFGLVSLIVLFFTGIYVLKSYHYPPHILAQKALKKVGLGNTPIAALFAPPPVRPDGLNLPDPADPDWNGIGAQNQRTLEPVVYDETGRPFPRGWLGKTKTQIHTIQNFKREITVQDAKELIAAIKKAEPGDRITLSPGVYKIQTYNIEVNRPGTPHLPINVRADRLGQAVVELNSLEGFLVSAPYWIFENITFKGTNPSHDQGEHAFHITGNAKGFVLRNCRLQDFNAMIKANGTSDNTGQRYFPDDALIENNSFFNTTIRNTSNPVTFIDVVGPDNWIIRGNFIADFSKGQGDTISYAAFVKGNAAGTIFENNLVIGEYRHTGGVRVGLSLGGGGTGKPYFREGKTDVEHTGGIMRNNVIMHCKDAGIYLNKAADTFISHNLLYKTMGIDVRFPQSTARIENNLLTARISDRDGGTSIRSNNLMLKNRLLKKPDSDTYFANPDMTDFSLNQGATIIDKGIPSQSVFEDICNRPRDDKPDIGPFEYSHMTSCPMTGTF